MKIIHSFIILFCIFLNFVDGQVQEKRLPIGEEIYAYEISCDNDLMLIVHNGRTVKDDSNDGYVEIFKTNTFTSIAKIKINNAGFQTKAVFSKDGKYVAYVNQKSLFVYDLKTKKTNQIIFDNTPYKLDISPDGNFIAVLHDDLSIFDFNRMKLIYTINRLEFYKPYLTLKYFNKSDRIAVGSEGEVDIFDTKKGKLLARLTGRLYSNSLYNELLITDNDSLLICAEYGKNLYFWDLNNYTCIKGYKFDPVYNVALSPDNNTVAILSDNIIYFWDIYLDKVFFQVNNAKTYSTWYYPLKFSRDFKNIYWFGRNSIYWYALGKDISRSKEYELIFKDYLSDINLKYKEYTLRDEFESLEEYIERAKNFLEDVILVKFNYINKINEKENEDLNQILKQGEEILNKIEASIRDTMINLEKVGEYDIDKKLLPLTIDGVTKNIVMSVEEAKSFKKNINEVMVKAKYKLKADLKNIELFDIIVIHPVSKTEYKF